MPRMKDSRLSDEWLARAWQQAPIMALPNGNFRTGPVRLTFVNLWKPQKNKLKPEADAKYGTTALFPHVAGVSDQINAILWPPAYNALKQKFPNNFGPDGQPYGLKIPFRDQALKGNLPGYTPGALFMTCTSQYKPQIVDPSLNPIIDEKRVYPGVWAILCINPYAYDQSGGKGVAFGLQSVMIVADDEQLAGKGSDAKTDFAGVRVDASFNPSAAFGMPAPGTATPAAQFMPGMPGAAPGHGMLPPAQPVWHQPPAAPMPVVKSWGDLM